MTPQERADNSHAMTRRTFIKTSSLLVGGAAVASGLEFETTPVTYAKASGNRTLRVGTPAEVGMSQDRLDDVAARLQNRIDRGLIPGAVILVARHGKTVLHKAFGVREVGKDAMTEDTLFGPGVEYKGPRYRDLLYDSHRTQCCASERSCGKVLATLRNKW